MSISTRFDTFCNNIKLTSSQRDDATTKVNNVCRTLHNYYYPNSTYNGSTKFLVGSYGKNTAIRPPGDVDVIFKIPFTKYYYFSEQKTGVRLLLNEVKDVLKNTFTTTEKIRPNGMIIEVNFTTFNIEVLPGYEWDTEGSLKGQFTVPDTSSSGLLMSLPLLTLGGTTQQNQYGRWKTIDPRAELNSLYVSDILTGNTKELARMIKQWTRNCNVPIKSVVIERLAIEFFNSYPQHKNKSSVYYDWITRDFFKFLKTKANTWVSMPTNNEDIYLSDDWMSKADSALGRAIKGCEYESKNDDFNAAWEWKKIFGENVYPY